MSEILLVNIVGTDRAGLTNQLTNILAEHQVRILDIGQAVIHDHLSLGMVIECPAGAATYEVMKQTMFKAHQLGLSIKFRPLSTSEYEEWVGQQVQDRHVLTILGRTIGADVLASISGLFVEQGLNIEKISRLSRRAPLDVDLDSNRECFEFSILGTPRNSDRFRTDLMGLTSQYSVDVALQRDDMFRRNRRLVVFDMDSTLIQCEVIDELAKLAGVGDQVSEITERAMQGELDFKSSFRERLKLLKGLPYEKALEFAERLPLTEGAERLLTTLKTLGYQTAICSGGFTLFGERLQSQLGIDYVYANELEIQNGLLTGEVVGEIVDGERKAYLMRQLADRAGISLQQCIAVGDGANDLPMIRQAGLGIAFHAKPTVRAGSKQAINVLGLDGILYLLGVRDRDLMREQVLQK